MDKLWCTHTVDYYSGEGGSRGSRSRPHREFMSWRGTGGSKNGIYSSSWALRGSGDMVWGGRRQDEGQGGGICVPEAWGHREH